VWFKVDFSKPIYSQIKKKIKEAIMKGELKHGELIPSVVLRKSLENEVLREFKNAVLSMKNAGFTLERVMRLVEKSWNG